jgi:hypothetical protein
MPAISPPERGGFGVGETDGTMAMGGGAGVVMIGIGVFVWVGVKDGVGVKVGVGVGETGGPTWNVSEVRSWELAPEGDW